MDQDLGAGVAAQGNSATPQYFKPASFTYSSGVSQQFPFIIGQAGNVVSNAYGLPLEMRQTTSGTAVQLNLTSKIGWNTISGPNCRLVLPVANIGSQLPNSFVNQRCELIGGMLLYRYFYFNINFWWKLY